ncbi:MAG TPA: hypothetical protein VOA64_06805 [Candidatus Dormibacteraeota bacterium]|nr:hypothetical protein [Candidatus Dormibacteraeota bacterium]
MNRPHDNRVSTFYLRLPLRTFSLIVAALFSGFVPQEMFAQTSTSSPCRVESKKFEGWAAQEMSNQWVKVTIVPQLGGRVMQVTFANHPYLFVNPKYKGQYIPPNSEEAKKRWINYGGDKIWPLPEGTEDEQHWPGPISDLLDDGDYSFKILSQDSTCKVRLEGPPDPKTGLQYAREISLGGKSPQISFHAVMKNITDHLIQWSVQSVTQYDTSQVHEPGDFNHEFRAFTPANPRSAYLNQYHVRSGLSDDPSFCVKDGLFRLHWLSLQSEVWVDSPGSWLAVMDGSAGYAMVERFHYFGGAEYPGKATVIFYKNGPSVELDDRGIPYINSSGPENSLHYMEAEVNSPIVRLQPGATYALDTNWFPTRMGKEFQSVTDAGLVGTSFSASSGPGGVLLSGVFGVFTQGKLEARLFDKHGVTIASIPVQAVSPTDVVDLHRVVKVPAEAARVSLHVIDQQGNDQGSLGEALVFLTERSS